jgi:2-dehydro-3-deoxyglucarate aldolase/4-hydroxy-2-oxoheptanedioate aldolase
MTQTFRTRLLAGEKLFGTVVTLTTPQASEALAAAGCDWLWIDMEHGPLDLGVTQSLLMAAEPTCAPVVRVPANDPVWLKRVLDLGPAGVIVPHVNSADAARDLVQHCRYPPRGTRSLGIGRAQGYGPGLADYLATAHERVAILPQIEHADAVAEIDAILAVEGVDCAVVGPFDLSASLGVPGQLDHPSVEAAMQRVTEACRRAGKPAGLFAGTSDFARKWCAEGFSCVAVGADVAMLSGAVAAQLAALRA